MTATQWVTALVPGLATNPSLAELIAIAREQVNPNWISASKYEYAVGLLTSHMLTIFFDPSLASSSGFITSKKEGDLAITYSMGGKGDLDRTTYGIQFQQLMESSNVSIGVTGGRDVLQN